MLDVCAALKGLDIDIRDYVGGLEEEMHSKPPLKNIYGITRD